MTTAARKSTRALVHLTERHPRRPVERARSHPRRKLAAGAVALALSSLLPCALTSATTTPPHPPATVTAVGVPYLGSPPAGSPAVVAVATSLAGGYYVLRADGTVSAFGTRARGSLRRGSLPFGVTATGIALDPATSGYWIVCSNGLVRGFHAPTFGEPHIPSGGWGQYPAAVAIASAVNGRGYFVLRANGAVDAFGVAAHGSLAGHLHYGATAPVVAVAMATDPATGGYWIVTSTGGVANFDAPFWGSPLDSAHGSYDGNATTSIAAAPEGRGYFVLRADGEVDRFTGVGYDSITPAPTLPVGATAVALAARPSSGGYYEALDEASVRGYLNPLRTVTSLVPQEIDQGVDYCGFGPIFALGDGVVRNVYDAGWPSDVFISYVLSNGPAKGLAVYVAENVTPAVHVGEHVTPQTVVGVLHDAKTCVEMGWADATAPNGNAAGRDEFNGRNSTAYGFNFSDLLLALGSRPGLPQPYGPPGALAPGWPRW